MNGILSLVLHLATGVLAVQSPYRPVSIDDALQIGAAAAYHAQRNGLDPFELIGIARNESDFQRHLVGPDGWDCGITQTRVKYSKYPCRRLRNDLWLGFEEAARELSTFQNHCLKNARHDLKRCRINSYNQGYRYAKRGRPGTYWLRVTCFAEAARLGVRPVSDCRRVQSRGQMARLLKSSRRLPDALFASNHDKRAAPASAAPPQMATPVE